MGIDDKNENIYYSKEELDKMSKTTRPCSNLNDLKESWYEDEKPEYPPGYDATEDKKERKEEDRPQMAEEAVIERIEQCTKELEAITYLEHRSYNSFDYFRADRKFNLTERKNELYKMILYMTQELKERI